MVEVPATRDLIQETEGMLNVMPQIRVWLHPHKVDKEEEDYFIICDSFEEAFRFIDSHPEAEEKPLIAFKGYEMNIWAIEPIKKDEKKKNQ